MEDRKHVGSDAVQNVVHAQYGVGMFLFEVFKVFLLAVVIIVPIRVFLFQPFFVKGASMEPNLHEGEYLIINEFGYKYTQIGLDMEDPWVTVKPVKELERGDVAVFRSPKDPSQYFIKRVIGLPGETVRVGNDSVTIVNEKFPDGFILDESAYLVSTVHTKETVALTLHADEYFVLGDNRPNSYDSRAWGPLNKNAVIGKVLVRAWPPNKVQLFMGK